MAIFFGSVSLLQRISLYLSFFKFVCPIKAILFMLVDLLKLLCAIFGSHYCFCIYDAVHCILSHCCMPVGSTFSKSFFCFSVSVSWWIHSCVCLIKANSCNMQELWPLNKDNMMYKYRLPVDFIYLSLFRMWIQ